MVGRDDCSGEEEHRSDGENISFMDLLHELVIHTKLLIFIPLAVGLATLVVTFFLPPKYQATAQFLPPQQQQSAASSMLLSLGSLGGLAGAASALKNPADQYIAFMKTRVIQDALITRFALMSIYESKLTQDARESLTRNTKIVAKDNIITVEFEDTDPQLAAKIANGYVDELSKMLDRMAVGEAQQRRVFFEKQLVGTKDNLVKAEQALAASGISVAALNSTPSIALENTAKLRAQVTALEIKLASIRSYLTPSSAEYRQSAAELGALRSQLTKAEREQPAGISGTNDYIAKYREYKYQESLFELFSRLYETAKVDESKQGVVQIVDPAEPPERKSKPKKGLLAVMATLATAFALMVFVIGRAIWRKSLDDPRSATKARRLASDFKKAFRRA